MRPKIPSPMVSSNRKYVVNIPTETAAAAAIVWPGHSLLPKPILEQLHAVWMRGSRDRDGVGDPFCVKIKINTKNIALRVVSFCEKGSAKNLKILDRQNKK